MTKFHLFSQDSVSLPSNGWEPWLETAPTGGVSPINTKNATCNNGASDSNTKNIKVLTHVTYPQGIIKKSAR
jgi:hypothetical protein